jgi:hypothetical protein
MSQGSGFTWQTLPKIPEAGVKCPESLLAEKDKDSSFSKRLTEN